MPSACTWSQPSLLAYGPYSLPSGLSFESSFRPTRFTSWRSHSRTPTTSSSPASRVAFWMRSPPWTFTPASSRESRCAFLIFRAECVADVIVVLVYSLHERAYPLRLRAFQAATLWEDLMNMRRGLSHEMTRLIRDVRSVRARIAAVSYVELQTVQLRTIDGKEVAQLHCELAHECLSAATPESNSTLFAVATPGDFGSASKTDEKGGTSAAQMSGLWHTT
ncbi:hypothetical protein V8D89_008368 [Ganoderma adspersum]